jgi:hypothetical protein
MNPISLMLYGIANGFPVVALLSHCAGGISTASGDMEPSTVSLYFYRITVSSIPRYSMPETKPQARNYQFRVNLELQYRHVISPSCRAATCLLMASTDAAIPECRSSIYAGWRACGDPTAEVRPTETEMTVLKLAFIGSLRIVFMGSLKIALFLYAIFLSDTPSAGVPEGNGYVGDKEGSMPSLR